MAGSRVNQQIFRCADPLEHLVARRYVIDPPAWYGVVTTTLYGGEKRDQGDRNCVHGRDLIAESNTLRECFNNVDVGVPLWQSEPRDKSSCREFASSHLSF